MSEEERAGEVSHRGAGSADELVNLTVTRSDQWRLRRLNQVVNKLRTERNGMGLVWVRYHEGEVHMQVVDLHRIVAEVLRRFEP